MLDGLRTDNLLDLGKTIASDIFAGKQYAWEVLPQINDFVISLGEQLDPAVYDRIGENVWAAKSAKIYKSAYIDGPCIIDEGAEIRHCAFIRGSVVVGKHAVVGNSTELKNVILFDGVQVPHYNYVGDSILGYKAHLGAGAITSNVKADKKPTMVRLGGEAVETGMKKFGAIIGDHVEIGCNSVLNPASVIGRESVIYPLSMVRGFVPPNSIYKTQGEIIRKRDS